MILIDENKISDNNKMHFYFIPLNYFSFPWTLLIVQHFESFDTLSQTESIPI